MESPARGRLTARLSMRRGVPLALYTLIDVIASLIDASPMMDMLALYAAKGEIGLHGG